MRIIGLTGAIACGKSTVSAVLAAHGAVIIDGDVLSREMTAPGGRLLPAIRAAFGDGVFAADGTLDRKALGAVVFGDPERLAQLNALYREPLHALIRERVAEAEAAGAELCVLDMPLLFEQGLDRLCDRVWCVTLTPEEQLRRLMLRDGSTREQALARIRSQMPAAGKAALAEIVIDMGGPMDYTEKTVLPLMEEELKLAKADRGGGADHGA